MKIKLTPIASITPYDRNPRNHDVDAIATSIREFGWQQPIVVDSKNIIVAGHGRYFAAQQLELKRVPIKVASDLSAEQIRAYRLADNKTNELGSWDQEMLLAEINACNETDWKAFGFDLSDISPHPDENIGSEPTILKPLFQIVIQCKSERNQTQLMKRFEKEGLECKAVIT